jgi:hypothetical protein
MTTAQTQQFPIPATAAEVPGPATGNAMTKEYVQVVGRIAYGGIAMLSDYINPEQRAAAFSS